MDKPRVERDGYGKVTAMHFPEFLNTTAIDPKTKTIEKLKLPFWGLVESITIDKTGDVRYEYRSNVVNIFGK